MVTWRDPVQMDEENELNQLWVDLERDVRDDPSFEEIVGIDDATMMAHAVEVVKQHFARLSEEGNLLAMISPESQAQLYTMGFVVGARFGRSHPLTKEQS
jgi:hypothetical protein